MKKEKSVFQFKISLLGIEPTIWRRIQVPSTYSFYDVHVAIQDAMGWDDSHLHAFRIRAPDSGEILTIGYPDDEGFGPPSLPGWEIGVSDLFVKKDSAAVYEYDFGDGWEHELILEEITPHVPRTKYPRCVDGARACPPEDCGGTHGYKKVLEALATPDDEESEDLLEWLGGSFDPEAFDATRVRFCNPRRRLESVFGEGF